MGSELSISKKTTSQVLVLNVTSLADPAAEFIAQVPAPGGGVTVTVPAAAGRTSTELADSIAALRTPVARENNTLVFLGVQVPVEEKVGFTFASFEQTATVPFSENKPAALASGFAALIAKIS